ncbi:MAG: HdeD family acid-resistance protein [Alphaproteobacteria bacterium]|nr:HdeD family acid-resistance protein [Alphaproteobacteria bacterium]
MAMETLGNHWRLYLFEGALLVVLGLGAIAVPAIASIAVASFLGWLFLVGGGVGLATALMSRRAPGFWWSLISAALALAAGVFLIDAPLRGAVSLAILLAAFLFADGVAMILFGLDHRKQTSKRWGWFVFNGVLDLGLAIIVVMALPAAALWVLGVIVGIDLVFGGSTLIALSLAARPKET